MIFEIGDTVRTPSGKFYLIRSFWTAMRDGRRATLAPLQSAPHRKHTNAALPSLSLVRSRELSLAFHYAAESERDGAEEWQRARARQQAGRWLTMAEQRDVDSRAELCMGSDRILELEAVAP